MYIHDVCTDCKRSLANHTIVDVHIYIYVCVFVYFKSIPTMKIYSYTHLVLLSYSLASTAMVKLPLYKRDYRIKRGAASLKDTLDSNDKVSFNKPRSHQQNHTAHVPVISDLQNLAIYTFIDIGTPAQTFKVALATENSSSDLWVLSVDCSDVGCTIHTRFNHSLSTTYVKNGTLYDDVLTSGYLSQDTVSIAGLTVVGQVFGEAVNPQRFDVLSDYEGYLGLGLLSFARTGTPPLFFNLLKQKLIEESVFGIYLVPWNSSHNTSSGELILGGRDPNRYTGELTYAPLTSKQHWQFKMNSVSIKAKFNDTISPAGCQGGCDAAIDSVNPFIVGPKKELDRINKMLGAINPDPDDNFIEYFDCSTIKTLPTLLLDIGDKELELSAEQYVLNLGNQICLSAFIGDHVSQWGLGAPFLEAVYTEFDVGNSRLGFAPAKY